ncbi:MAG TPA: hypothetical protein VM513_31245, partial [Kofleriaceae bacterium]|nr:hypothetical protein [Kofleriaceae bacterium]
MRSRKGDAPGEPARLPARWGFSKGLLTGAAIEIPALAATVWLLAQAGFGDPDVSFMHVIRLTAAFAGIAALLTAGGIGRLAAHAAVHGRRRAMWVAARAHAAASAGLLIIAAIPHGVMPQALARFRHEIVDPFETVAPDVAPSIWAWLLVPGAGLVVGALCGALIGAVCGGAAPVGLSDVWSLARRPTDALGQLLGPKDIAKLGAALRTRTTHLFEGIFEPAPKPPA